MSICFTTSCIRQPLSWRPASPYQPAFFFHLFVFLAGEIPFSRSLLGDSPVETSIHLSSHLSIHVAVPLYEPLPFCHSVTVLPCHAIVTVKQLGAVVLCCCSVVLVPVWLMIDFGLHRNRSGIYGLFTFYLFSHIMTTSAVMFYCLPSRYLVANSFYYNFTVCYMRIINFNIKELVRLFCWWFRPRRLSSVSQFENGHCHVVLRGLQPLIINDLAAARQHLHYELCDVSSSWMELRTALQCKYNLSVKRSFLKVFPLVFLCIVSALLVASIWLWFMHAECAGRTIHTTTAKFSIGHLANCQATAIMSFCFSALPATKIY